MDNHTKKGEEPCQKSQLEHDLKQVMVEKGVDLRQMELAHAMTFVNAANVLRDKFAHLILAGSSKTFSPAVWSLLDFVRAKGTLENFFILPLREVSNNSDSVGVFLPMSGKEWSKILPSDSPFGRKEMQIMKHVIANVLLLHLLGISHQNINRSTILIDHHHIPRLTFPLVKETEKQELDWKALNSIFTQTWFDNLALHPPRYAQLLMQILNLLQDGSDQQVLLAWTILSTTTN